MNFIENDTSYKIHFVCFVDSIFQTLKKWCPKNIKVLGFINDHSPPTSQSSQHTRMTGAPALPKHGRELDEAPRQTRNLHRLTLSNCCKLIQKDNVVVLFATKSNQTTKQTQQIVLATAIPLTKTHLKEFQRQKTSCQTAPKPQLRNFFGNIFRQCPLRRCRALFPPGWWSKKAKNTDILGEKHDKQWLLKMWCLVCFQKKWLACLV